MNLTTILIVVAIAVPSYVPKVAAPIAARTIYSPLSLSRTSEREVTFPHTFAAFSFTRVVRFPPTMFERYLPLLRERKEDNPRGLQI